MQIILSNAKRKRKEIFKNASDLKFLPVLTKPMRGVLRSTLMSVGHYDDRVPAGIKYCGNVLENPA